VDESLVAGNSDTNAWGFSPAGVESVITVASTDRDDWMQLRSNYGAVVTLFAPGVSVESTWYVAGSRCKLMERLTFSSRNDGGSKTLSGTSMAGAHVAGLVAYFLSIDRSLTPRTVTELLDRLAVQGLVTMPEAARRAGTPNKLAWNGATYVPPPPQG